MNIKYIEFKNFQSYGNQLQRIDFSDSSNFSVIVGDNGAGKSTISDIIKFAIYGSVANKRIPDLANRINKNAYTKIELIHNGKNIVIERGIKPNFVKLFINNETKMDTKDLLFRAKEFIREDYFYFFEKYCDKYEINTALRLAHFLAQVNHESSNMKVIEENLNYSAKQLLKVFPKYFKTLDEAKKYEYKGEKIANKVYANRMGNGDEQSGDGYRYRGRGLIQLTGKNNYLKFSRWYNDSKIFVDNPDLLLQPQFAVLSAFFYWDINNLNSYIVDNENAYNICKCITKKINGGYNGLEERFRLYKKIRELYNEFDKDYYE